MYEGQERECNSNHKRRLCLGKKVLVVDAFLVVEWINKARPLDTLK